MVPLLTPLCMLVTISLPPKRGEGPAIKIDVVTPSRSLIPSAMACRWRAEFSIALIKTAC